MQYPWFVITGDTSPAQTELMSLLKQQDYHIVGDVNSADHQEALQKHIRQHVEAPRDRTVFFTGGIPDVLARYRQYDYPYDPLLRHGLQYVHYRAVFLLGDLLNSSDTYIKYLKEAYRDVGCFLINIKGQNPNVLLHDIKQEVGTSISIAQITQHPMFADKILSE